MMEVEGEKHMVSITRQLLTESDCYKEGRALRPQGVMVHSVGVAQPNPQVFIQRWNKSGVDACVHAFVNDKSIVQTLPWECRAWHCGGKANNTHLAFECCEPAGHTYQGGTMVGYDSEKNRAYFQAMYRNAVDLTAWLCRRYELDPTAPGVVICHAEGNKLGLASNHADVLQWWPRHGITMDRFRTDVKTTMAKMDEEEETVTQQQFNGMMDAYLKARGQASPSAWSQQAREWAEKAGYIAGSGGGEMRYPAFVTREELIQILYAALGREKKQRVESEEWRVESGE